jgi:hypothetical protein
MARCDAPKRRFGVLVFALTLAVGLIAPQAVGAAQTAVVPPSLPGASTQFGAPNNWVPSAR